MKIVTFSFIITSTTPKNILKKKNSKFVKPMYKYLCISQQSFFVMAQISESLTIQRAKP